ncbi:hemolysin III family protein [Curtobacterium sp. VKM Ac-2865]|uniref:PAQR family membrane homeostasis protein TrhA n=1 Tax=Curtobacterium sp. VKM Ac-2865 TaxID=2783817 RepID=UPI00188B2FE8|nr:hemolysin III family protein [Curtobacterium sp. VKM Ac-2865]MBF4583942.1 hemolysin III family protein [Curtobacterium sp. VKM Ac-2865]
MHQDRDTDTIPHVPFTEEAATAADERPAWRGWIHLGTFPFALAMGIVLVTLAATPAAKAGTTVFAATSLIMFGVSATYHRFPWSPVVKRVLKRIDHTNIFLLIAGTYTPVAVCALPHTLMVVVLWVMWGGALLGIAFRVFWIGAPRWLYVPLYLALGCAALGILPQLFAASAPMTVLVLAGGLAYVLGAVVYGFKRPNPSPAFFGFHEVFHALTVVAFAAQWAGILLVALHPVR